MTPNPSQSKFHIFNQQVPMTVLKSNSFIQQNGHNASYDIIPSKASLTACNQIPLKSTNQSTTSVNNSAKFQNPRSHNNNLLQEQSSTLQAISNSQSCRQEPLFPSLISQKKEVIKKNYNKIILYQQQYSKSSMGS